MKSFTLATLATLAVSLGLATGQLLECDGAWQPDYDDCEMVMDYFNMEGSDHITHTNGELNPAPSCYHWWWDGGNCFMSHCFIEAANPGIGYTDGEIFGFYEGVRDRCKPFAAGGYQPGAAFDFWVTNDEGGDGPPNKRASKEKRANFPGLQVDFAEDGFSRGHTTLEEFLEWHNDTKSGIEKAHGTIAKRQSGDIAKRQSEDTSWLIWFSAYSVRNPDVFTRGLRLPTGSDYTYEVSESNTYSVTTSVSIGAAIEVFSASVGTEITEEETFTVSEGVTFSVDCGEGGSGQITFYPLYDYYEVNGRPSMEDYNIWLPVLDSNRLMTGEIAVACLG